tara:strand:- start:360 stop:1076 length:717 start_codon:yes stop_codon:yes gene_type:complete
MSGHSKWSQIKRKKAKTDIQRGKLFSKLAKEIIIAASQGGEDLDLNPSLRFSVQKAKGFNLPQANILRSIQKGAGKDSQTNYEELFYEAYGVNGVALLIKTLTDNSTRTVANIKYILSRNNANMASKGAVRYLFEERGLFIFNPDCNQDFIIDLASQVNALDFNIMDDGSIEVYTTIDTFDTIRTFFEKNNAIFETALLTYIPSSTVFLSPDLQTQLDNLIDALDDDDDVQDIYTNSQ